MKPMVLTGLIIWLPTNLKLTYHIIKPVFCNAANSSCAGFSSAERAKLSTCSFEVPLADWRGQTFV